jgi:hypothetical protein
MCQVFVPLVDLTEVVGSPEFFLGSQVEESATELTRGVETDPPAQFALAVDDSSHNRPRLQLSVAALIRLWVFLLAIRLWWRWRVKFPYKSNVEELKAMKLRKVATIGIVPTSST